MELLWGMGINTALAEQLVEEGYRRAGIKDPSAVLLPGQLIRMRFGAESIAIVPGFEWKASVARSGRGRVFSVSAELSLLERRFCLSHELAHVVCEEAGFTGPNLEEMCDYIGAAFQTRRKPFSNRVREVGANFRQLALDFGTTESWIALRYGEVTRQPLALVAPKTVRVRGRVWEWGTIDNVRRMALHGARGVAKASLSDDPARVALLASG